MNEISYIERDMDLKQQFDLWISAQICLEQICAEIHKAKVMQFDVYPYWDNDLCSLIVDQ